LFLNLLLHLIIERRFNTIFSRLWMLLLFRTFNHHFIYHLLFLLVNHSVKVRLNHTLLFSLLRVITLLIHNTKILRWNNLHYFTALLYLSFSLLCRWHTLSPLLLLLTVTYTILLNCSGCCAYTVWLTIGSVTAGTSCGMMWHLFF